MTVLSSSLLTPADLGLPPKFTHFRPGATKSQPGQLQIIESIAYSNNRFDFLCAPPGSGKTAICAAVTRILGGRAHWLTVTKALGTQVVDEFESIGAFEIKGHSNFTCAGRNHSTDDFECLTPSHCGYRADIETSINRSIVVDNYAHALTVARSEKPDRLGPFSILILDEAHKVRNTLCDFMAVTVSESQISQLLDIQIPKTLDPLEWIEWAQVAVVVCQERWSDSRFSFSNSNRSSRRMGKSRSDRSDNGNSDSNSNSNSNNLLKLGRDLARLSEADHSPGAWVCEKGKVYRQPHHITLTPVWGRSYAFKYLFQSINKIILCSGTLTPQDGINLGISPDDCERGWHEMPSIFDPKRRPLIYIPTCRVDARMTEVDKKQLVKIFDEIAESRIFLANGLIQSRSYEYQKMMDRLSDFRAYLISYTRDNARDTIEKFKQMDPPGVLNGPTFQEGEDFFGSMAHWQFIVKIPFLSAHDPLTKARMKVDKYCMDRETARALIQMVGRLMRSSTDFGESFICDMHAGYFLWKKVKLGRFIVPLFPRWFLDAFRMVETVPEPLEYYFEE